MSKRSKNYIILIYFNIEKDSQHSLELVRFQQTIKEQAVTIHSLQNELQVQQVNFLF